MELLSVNKEALRDLIDEVMAERGYVPESDKVGKTIDIKEFSKTYCGGRSKEWIKEHIFYEYHPDWVEDINPGTGRKFIIHEYEASRWMGKHWRDVLDRAR